MCPAPQYSYMKPIGRFHWLHLSAGVASTKHWVQQAPKLKGAESRICQSSNRLTRAARDIADSGEKFVPRTQLNYVATALLFGKKLKRDMGSDEIANVFTERTLARARALDLPAEDIAELRAWLNPYIHPRDQT
jgi:hypothetical protein